MLLSSRFLLIGRYSEIEKEKIKRLCRQIDMVETENYTAIALRVRYGSYDLILASEETAIKVAECVRSIDHPCSAGIPILVILHEEPDMRKVYESGIDGYLNLEETESSLIEVLLSYLN